MEIEVIIAGIMQAAMDMSDTCGKMNGNEKKSMGQKKQAMHMTLHMTLRTSFLFWCERALKSASSRAVINTAGPRLRLAARRTLRPAPSGVNPT